MSTAMIVSSVVKNTNVAKYKKGNIMSRKKQITLVSKKSIIKINNVAKLEKGKTYLVSLDDFNADDVGELQRVFTDHGIDNVIIVVASSMTIAELPDQPALEPKTE